MNKTGHIYGIRNKETGRIYVGKTINLKSRWARHKTQLKRGVHRNVYLQRSYDKHGVGSFEYVILEICTVDNLHVREQYWIDHYLDTVYNHDKYVLDDAGIHNSFYGKRHTKAAKLKMSESKRGKYIGSDNPNFGNQYPLAVRLRMVKTNSRTKLTEKDVLEIVDLLRASVPHAEIAKMKKVSRTVITRISNGTRWQNVTGGPVIPVVYKNGVRQFTQNHRNKIGQSHIGMKYKMKEKLCLG